MIKYLGSKRRLVPALAAIARAAEARTAVDLFTGTTRVAQAFKQAGAHVTAIDTARYAAMFARCYIETDARSIDGDQLARSIDGLNALPGTPGYVTDVFCEQARFFQPANGARIPVGQLLSFDWGDVAGAASYTIQISTTSTFSSTLVDQVVPASLFATSSLPAQSLFWRVRANAAGGSAGTWSAVGSFRVK